MKNTPLDKISKEVFLCNYIDRNFISKPQQICWFGIKFDQKFAANVDFITEETHSF